MNIATTNPRIDIVSGMASITITVVLSSGFSARLAAAAGPMRDCAQAVARAGIAMATAALRVTQKICISASSSG